jgi:hypothetical protein
MKKIYPLSLLFSVLLFSGCSKDFLKDYDKRILGTWRISDVNRIGIGGNPDNLPLKEGTFTFNDGGSLVYVSPANVTYQGSWDLKKKTIGEENVRSLHITAIDFSGQHVITEYYDDMNFSGTNHFKARIISRTNTIVTHFRR